MVCQGNLAGVGYGMTNHDGHPIRASILVVDDDAAIRESFEAVLSKDYDLLFAAQGPEALRILSTRDVNLVLLDIRMPGMDGIEVLRRIKDLNEQTEVVIVTAVKSLKTAIEAIKLGASDYITKPFDTHDILSLIKRVVEKQELAQGGPVPALGDRARPPLREPRGAQRNGCRRSTTWSPGSPTTTRRCC